MENIRLKITTEELNDALRIGLPCFYFFDVGSFVAYKAVEEITGKKPFYDNGHPIPELYLSQKHSIEGMLREAGIPLGQGYYVILK